MSEVREKSARRSPEERIAEFDKKIDQLRARKQQLAAQLNQRDRKARTRRLIEIGAIFEKNFDLVSKEEALFISGKLSNQVKELLQEIRKPTS